jgi:bifunctional DNA-binding transcriptional regulator/antitoxin component of YhaV-PrlF toxin-antitoxin module
MKTAIEKCKDNLFIVLPKDAVARLDWGHGDILDIEAIDGGLKIVRTMTNHDHAMEIAREVMEEYRETFEALAKS